MSYRRHVRDRLRDGAIATWTEDRGRWWAWESDGVLVEASGHVSRGDVYVTIQPRRLGGRRWGWVVEHHYVQVIDVDEVPEAIRDLVCKSQKTEMIRMVSDRTPDHTCTRLKPFSLATTSQTKDTITIHPRSRGGGCQWLSMINTGLPHPHQDQWVAGDSSHGSNQSHRQLEQQTCSRT